MDQVGLLFQRELSREWSKYGLECVVTTLTSVHMNHQWLLFVLLYDISLHSEFVCLCCFIASESYRYLSDTEGRWISDYSPLYFRVIIQMWGVIDICKAIYFGTIAWFPKKLQGYCFFECWHWCYTFHHTSKMPQMLSCTL